MWCLVFFESFCFLVKRLTATVAVVEQTLAPVEETVDLSKRSLDTYGMEFLIAFFRFRNLLHTQILSLNLSWDHFTWQPLYISYLLENLTCLYVNDNRLTSLPGNMRSLKGLQELDLRNNQLKRLDVVKELPRLKKLLVEGNPLTLEEIRCLMKHVDTTTRTIFVDIAGSVTCKYGNKSLAYSSTMLSWSKDCVSLTLW